MGANNYGNANITFRYKHPAKAENFNSVLRGVCPSGIYRGGTVSYIGNILTLATYTAIFESSIDKATTVTTASAIDLSVVTTFGGNANSSTPYVIMRYAYSNIISNYPDYYQVAIGDIQSTDIIICKVLFDGGGVVNGIDYSESHTAPQYNKDLNTFNISCDTYVKNKKINKEVTTAIDSNTTTNELICDTSLFFTPTADRTLDITAGASNYGTSLKIYHSGSLNYKITITYASAQTVVLTRKMFLNLEYTPNGWQFVKESRIGQISSGYIIPRGAYEFNGQLIEKTHPLWHYITEYYASLIVNNVGWLAGGSTLFNDYNSTYFGLPDLRGIFQRNVGTNSVLKTSNGTPYDGGAIGTILLDRLQGHWHEFKRGIDSSLIHDGNKEDILVSGGVIINDYVRKAITDGVNGTPNIGNQTAPVSVSMYSYIYFED